MGEARVTQAFAGSVHEAEQCWYATDEWPAWVDGLARVVEVSPEWPEAGSQVIWESFPAGRGRVREVVVEYAPRQGQAVSVEDDSITGTQRIVFAAAADGVQAELSLEYRIKRRSPLTPVIDWLFVRRLMAASLSRTLERFGTALAASRPDS